MLQDLHIVVNHTHFKIRDQLFGDCTYVSCKYVRKLVRKKCVNFQLPAARRDLSRVKTLRRTSVGSSNGHHTIRFVQPFISLATEE